MVYKFKINKKPDYSSPLHDALKIYSVIDERFTLLHSLVQKFEHPFSVFGFTDVPSSSHLFNKSEPSVLKTFRGGKLQFDWNRVLLDRAWFKLY